MPEQARVTISVGQLITLALTILGSVIGAAWFLFAYGSFLPNMELITEATENKISYQRSEEDYQRLNREKLQLIERLGRKDLEISTLKSQNEFKIRELQFLESRNRLASEVVSECVASSDAGQGTDEVIATQIGATSTNTFVDSGGAAAGNSAAAAAITSYNRPHDGAKALSGCIDKFKTLLEILEPASN